MIFRKRKHDLQPASLGRLTWQRLKRNALAVTGMVVIAAACIAALLGYLITPDSTPYANDQKPELSIRPPGSANQFLLVRRNVTSEPDNFISRMLFGKPTEFDSHAFTSYSFSGPDIIIREFTGGVTGGDSARFNLADVLFSIPDRGTIKYDPQNSTVEFLPAGENEKRKMSVTRLQELVTEDHLVKRTYWLGTDLLGRDMLSRLLIGTRISLGVGLISVLISISIGIALGAMAGYFRGKTDSLIMWLINVVWSIPTLLLVIAITFVLGKGVTQVFIAVGLTMWVDVARIVRGQVLGIREKEFVEAGKALGYGHGRIIFRHILPNVMGPVVVIAASNFATAILLEAGLSFLGIGAQPPVPSWGEMINAHRGYILMDKAYLAFIPGAAIMLLVLAFMLVGNGLRDALDTRAVDARSSV